MTYIEKQILHNQKVIISALSLLLEHSTNKEQLLVKKQKDIANMQLALVSRQTSIETLLKS